MRAHAQVEDHIRRLKDSGLCRFPFTDIDANRAWLATVCFAGTWCAGSNSCASPTPLARAEPTAALAALARPRPAHPPRPP